MSRSTFLAYALCAVVVAGAVAACSNAEPFSPTLPSTTTTTSPDGTVLKATSPTPQTPTANAEVPDLRPTLVVSNASTTFGQVSLGYIFQLYEGDTLLRQTDSVTTTADQTSWQVPANLITYQKSYRWRARATSSTGDGPWSAFTSFTTGAAPAVSASASPGPVQCAGSSGPEIVACVGAAYPEKLVSTSNGDFSDERRKANMAFIRDRIIETGICKGMDLARNFKRGTPEISYDFIVLRRPGHHDAGVDIAHGYDATRSKLDLGWAVWEGPSYGHPFYARYPPVDCSGVQ